MNSQSITGCFYRFVQVMLVACYLLMALMAIFYSSDWSFKWSTEGILGHFLFFIAGSTIFWGINKAITYIFTGTLNSKDTLLEYFMGSGNGKKE